MDLVTARALLSPAGRQALAAAGPLADRLFGPDSGSADPLLALGAAVRATGVPADLAAAVTQQVVARRRLAARLGPAADVLLVTPDGAQQVTRPGVAARHADRYARAGRHLVADLGCGLGGDLLALAASGRRVLGVERDPVTAVLARANAAALHLADRVAVVRADAVDVGLAGVDGVFVDPARRTGGGASARAGAGRTLDPARWSPPYRFVLALPDRVRDRAVGAKLAPGIAHHLLPASAEAEWVSDGGEVLEAGLWWGPLATPGVRRRATVLPAGTSVTEADDPFPDGPPVGPVQRHLYSPDGAVVRAGLVGAVVAATGGHLLDPRIAYVTADRAVATPLARRLVVEEVLPTREALLRPALRARGVGSLEIMKRGWSGDVATLRRRLRLAGPHQRVLVLTRVADRHVALLCRAVAAG